MRVVATTISVSKVRSIPCAGTPRRDVRVQAVERADRGQAHAAALRRGRLGVGERRRRVRRCRLEAVQHRRPRGRHASTARAKNDARIDPTNSHIPSDLIRGPGLTGRRTRLPFLFRSTPDGSSDHVRGAMLLFFPACGFPSSAPQGAHRAIRRPADPAAGHDLQPPRNSRAALLRCGDGDHRLLGQIGDQPAGDPQLGFLVERIDASSKIRHGDRQHDASKGDRCCSPAETARPCRRHGCSGRRGHRDAYREARARQRVLEAPAVRRLVEVDVLLERAGQKPLGARDEEALEIGERRARSRRARRWSRGPRSATAGRSPGQRRGLASPAFAEQGAPSRRLDAEETLSTIVSPRSLHSSTRRRRSAEKVMRLRDRRKGVVVRRRRPPADGRHGVGADAHSAARTSLIIGRSPRRSATGSGRSARCSQAKTRSLPIGAAPGSAVAKAARGTAPPSLPMRRIDHEVIRRVPAPAGELDDVEVAPQGRRP